MLFHNKDTYQDTAKRTCHSGTDGGCYATQENCNKTVQIKQPVSHGHIKHAECHGCIALQREWKEQKIKDF